MTETIKRLWQILRVVENEDIYLQGVTQRLFPRQEVISPVWLENLLATPEGIDRLESFVGKFSRMQDALVRLNNSARGGDVDLMLELPKSIDNPALRGRAIGGTRLMRPAWSQHGCADQRTEPTSCACPFTTLHSRKDGCRDIETRNYATTTNCNES